MKIKLTSLFVDNQANALKFYTNILGFQKKHDVPLGEFRWLTVTSPDDGNGVELLLEPNQNPTAKTFQADLFAQGIAAAVFNVDDIQAEYERLKNHQVEFRTTPMQAGPVKIAVFNDTCGNWIQILQA